MRSDNASNKNGGAVRKVRNTLPPRAAPSLLYPPVLWTSLSRIRDERERPAHIEKTSSPLESNFNRFAAPLPLLSRSLSLLCSVCPLLSLLSLLSLSVKAGRRIKGDPQLLPATGCEIDTVSSRNLGCESRHRTASPSVWPRRRHRQTVGLRG